MDSVPLYQQVADHYRQAIRARALAPGDRMPSVRVLMRQHAVSLSTALQACRQLESDGLLEARPRSGYFVCVPASLRLAPLDEPVSAVPDSAQYVGIHQRIASVLARSHGAAIRFSLGGARGAPSLYPLTALNQATSRVLRGDPDVLGRAVTPSGDPILRAALARLALQHRMTLSPDEILITHGCTEALQLALRAVAAPGDVVAVESPCYYGLLQILESLNIRALEIPCSPTTGMSLEALDLAIRTEPQLRAVVVVPTLQNPLGSIMPDANRLRLMQLCEEHSVALIEDDCLSGTVDDEAPPAIKSHDRTGNVIFCASLHKLLAPGLRIGWLSGGRWHGRIAMLKFALSRPNEMLSQRAVADFLATGGYDRHMRRLRTALRAQREWTARFIAANFPAGTRLTLPRGGLCLWVSLPDGVSSEAVFEEALEQGVYVAPGFMFSNSNRFDRFLRINCGTPRCEELESAMVTVASIVRRLARA
ncbi:aminotransferase-like domain-containing protein [Paraburkholderia adhaesiva]|uniref:aminotransferase-like domain-containing protein n=1 Tax=Paraburkholderia adhaesiva TaxID=2883244 RepID=UPI001F3431AF|nr:PLP-dependent aminotransferase family protein [Paraburkholderia adhaesiva]